jgi:hypothetical protein
LFLTRHQNGMMRAANKFLQKSFRLFGRQGIQRQFFSDTVNQDLGRQIAARFASKAIAQHQNGTVRALDHRETVLVDFPVTQATGSSNFKLHNFRSA